MMGPSQGEGRRLVSTRGPCIYKGWMKFTSISVVLVKKHNYPWVAKATTSQFKWNTEVMASKLGYRFLGYSCPLFSDVLLYLPTWAYRNSLHHVALSLWFKPSKMHSAAIVEAKACFMVLKSFIEYPLECNPADQQFGSSQSSTHKVGTSNLRPKKDTGY